MAGQPVSSRYTLYEFLGLSPERLPLLERINLRAKAFPGGLPFLVCSIWTVFKRLRLRAR